METTTLTRKKEVAKQAKSSHILLYQLVTGHRNASADLAARIEYGAKGELDRGDLNVTCASCKYYKKCQSADTVK
jgi:hypothetical protein